MQLMHGRVAQLALLFDCCEGFLKNRNGDAPQDHVTYQRFRVSQSLGIELDRGLACRSCGISGLRPELRHLAERDVALTEFKSFVVLPSIKLDTEALVKKRMLFLDRYRQKPKRRRKKQLSSMASTIED